MPGSKEENSFGNLTCIADYRLQYCILEEVYKIKKEVLNNDSTHPFHTATDP
jgi:hypothetical protein